MKILKSAILLITGAAFGVATVLSCGDDARHSDAATCDCPASEAPIAGRIVTIDSDLVTVQPGAQGAPGIACDPGMQFISGSCSDPTVLTGLDDVVLQEAAFDKASGSWGCVFKNNKASAIRVRATVLCLKPST